MLWYGFRHYDPALGRFTQPDTIVPEQAQGTQAWDRYAYVNNNPVRYNDPTGHCIDGISTLVCIAVAGAVAGAAISYGSQVYNNLQNNGGDWGSALTTNIDGGAILAGAATGAAVAVTAAVLAPVAVAMVGEGLMGVGMLTGSTTVFSAGTATYGAAGTLAATIYGVSASSNLPNTATSQPSSTSSTTSSPNFVVTEGGVSIPVPQGATGPMPTQNGLGFRYEGGAGGSGLNSQVSGVRIMDPTTRYPNGYVNYYNQSGQSVNPYTGQTVGKASEWWHIEIK